jgi:uncharacterized protein YdaU (DUF1376 family)
MASEKREFPYFPIYWSDWLTGQATSDMTAEEEGAFLNLLLWAWGRKPACTLPSDREWLASKSKLGKRFEKAWPRLAPLFDVLEDGTLRNAKQWNVYLDRVRLSEAGSKGGKNRVANAQAEGQAQGQAEPQAKPQAGGQADGQANTQPSLSVSLSDTDVTASVSTKRAGPKVIEQPFKPHAVVAPLIREHFWLGKDVPAIALHKDPGWTMGREITICEQWAKDYGWDAIVGMVPLFRSTLDIDSDQPLSCKFFHAKDGRHKLNEVHGRWLKMQEHTASKPKFGMAS